jgi:translation initiation factor 2B subunit (eIF-2B alpha/beta/delta family)
MSDVDSPKNTIQRVTEVYVAVFPVSVSGGKLTEVILAGYRKDPSMANMMQIRATVETNAEAVKDMVALCDEIVDEQEGIASYRLLKFDKDGVHTLSPDDFRAFEQRYGNVQWGYC